MPSEQIAPINKIGQSIYTNPSQCGENNLIAGKTVLSLGIYGMPGTSFWLSAEDVGTDRYFTINGSGLLTLNSQDIPLNHLQLKPIDSEVDYTSWILIIDMIYQDKEDVPNE